MSMYEQFKTDQNAERDGIWIDYQSFRVRIAYAGGSNKQFQKAMERVARPYRRAIATESLSPEVSEMLLRKVYASAVIKGWETMVDGEFKPGIEQEKSTVLMKATPEHIEKTLAELPSLFEDLKSQAGSWALFKAALREEAAGN